MIDCILNLIDNQGIKYIKDGDKGVSVIVVCLSSKVSLQERTCGRFGGRKRGGVI